jgi:hypothetical protein
MLIELKKFFPLFVTTVSERRRKRETELAAAGLLFFFFFFRFFPILFATCKECNLIETYSTAVYPHKQAGTARISSVVMSFLFSLSL